MAWPLINYNWNCEQYHQTTVSLDIVTIPNHFFDETMNLDNPTYHLLEINAMKLLYG